MIHAKIGNNESERIAVLKSLNILDSEEELEYDSLVSVAAKICKTPISLITLVDEDRQWFKAKYGLTASETKREVGFCAHAINDPDELFVVKDARQDERFFDNPLVAGGPNIVFYAGAPIVTKEGFALGTLCVIDNVVKELTKEQKDMLSSLAHQVSVLLELRKAKIENKLAIEKISSLEKFRLEAIQEFKAPLNSLSILISFLKKAKLKLSLIETEMIELMGRSAEQVLGLVDGLLEYMWFEKQTLNKTKKIKVQKFLSSIKAQYLAESNLEIKINTEVDVIVANEKALENIFKQLISNAIRYNDKLETCIDINIVEKKDLYTIAIMDNGPGIPEGAKHKIFDFMLIWAYEDKYGNRGNGIGLTLVKNLVTKMGGDIEVSSNVGMGTGFTFWFKKPKKGGLKNNSLN